MYNQAEINSVDQSIWKNRRFNLHSQIRSFCHNNQIAFSHHVQPALIAETPQDVIVSMWLFDLIPKYSHWELINNKCQQHGKIVIVLTDNIIKYNDLPYVKFFSYPKLLGITATPSNISLHEQHPSKLYNCFIQRVDSTRQSWFYFLHHYKLLDHGYVSLLLKQLLNYSTLTGQELFDYIHNHYQLNQLPHFESAYYAMRDKVPYQNFQEEQNLLPLILDSKYSIVLETYAVEDNCDEWCFTEKTLRTLQLPTIPLLFLQKNGIGILKSLGFEFTDCLNLLDDLPWHDRQKELLNILINDNIDYDYKLLYDQSQHNKNLLASWQLEIEQSDFFNEFYEKALEL